MFQCLPEIVNRGAAVEKGHLGRWPLQEQSADLKIGHYEDAGRFEAQRELKPGATKARGKRKRKRKRKKKEKSLSAEGVS